MDNDPSFATNYAVGLRAITYMRSRGGGPNKARRHLVVQWSVSPKLSPGTSLKVNAVVFEGESMDYVLQSPQSIKIKDDPINPNTSIVKAALKPARDLTVDIDPVVADIADLTTTITIGNLTYPSYPPTISEEPIDIDPCL